MENLNIKKQAKSDIFKELYPIISFYIKKGAKPNSLKKYYKNSKRFNDILEDIRNKGINLIKDETEYRQLVKEILNEILNDFIAKEKDDNYKKNDKKMKHLKEFNSYLYEEISISDVRRNLDELTFDARWSGKRLTYKVYVQKYLYKENGDLKLYLEVEKNDQIGSNIMIVVGNSMNSIFMYHDSGQSIDAAILPATKSLLLAIRERLSK